MEYGPEEYADHVDALYDTLFRPSLNPSNSSKSKAELDMLAEETLSTQLSRVHKVSQAVWEFYDEQLDALEERCSSPDSQRYWWRPFTHWQQQQWIQSDTAAAGGDDDLDLQGGIPSPFAGGSRSSFFS